MYCHFVARARSWRCASPSAAGIDWPRLLFAAWLHLRVSARRHELPEPLLPDHPAELAADDHLPLNRAVSFDAALASRDSRRQPSPAWALWLVRFHIALPYFFGGVAKLNADWLAGEPMRQMLAGPRRLPACRPAASRRRWCRRACLPGAACSWTSAIVPLLAVEAHTRSPPTPLCVVFHVAELGPVSDPYFSLVHDSLRRTIFFEPGLAAARAGRRAP